MITDIDNPWVCTSPCGVLGRLKNGGAYIQEGFSITRISRSKQASMNAALQVKIRFAFTGSLVKLQNVIIKSN